MELIRIYTKRIGAHDVNGWHNLKTEEFYKLEKPDMYEYKYIDIDSNGEIHNSGSEDISISRYKNLTSKFYEVSARFPETRTDVKRKTYSETIKCIEFLINRKNDDRTTLNAWKKYVFTTTAIQSRIEDIRARAGEINFRKI